MSVELWLLKAPVRKLLLRLGILFGYRGVGDHHALHRPDDARCNLETDERLWIFKAWA